MKKIMTIVGARPQFIKSSAISKVIAQKYDAQLEEILIHTGQHYDHNMSQIFFDELEITTPKYNLNIGSSSHASQTAAMLVGISEILESEKPDAVLVYGDTNSTLAGALAAAKLHITIVHVEAGIRSFNKSMPEEINRIVCDSLSTLLFTPTDSGLKNLAREGLINNPEQTVNIDNPKIYRCGDVMFDVTESLKLKAQQMTFDKLGIALTSKKFSLCTIHRDSNTDNPVRLNNLFQALLDLTSELEMDLILPLHPRTKKMLEINLATDIYEEIKSNQHFKIIEPQGYLATQFLLSQCEVVLTDSGGLQKEAYFHHKPVVVLRSETEWIELLENGHATICDDNHSLIISTVRGCLENPITHWPDLYGDGKAAEFICAKMIEHLS